VGVQILSLCISMVSFRLALRREETLKARTPLVTGITTTQEPKFLLPLAGVLGAVLLATLLSVPGALADSRSAGSDEANASARDNTTQVTIPGPLRSFLRMAGISQKISSEQVLPLLAHNIFALGYEGSGPKGRPSEFLILLTRYVQQARELRALAGPDAVLDISTCEQAKPLLKILGYRARTDCGQHSSYLETADAQRAFLTIDSGFPLPELEKSLQDGHEFRYSFGDSQVAAIPVEAEWSRREKKHTDVLDMILGDPDLARFYWALARMDNETVSVLRKSHALKKMASQAAALDFYGSHIYVRNGRVVVPGGPAASAAWKDLVGANPDSPDEFIPKLVAKDTGWLAAYFDVLSTVPASQQSRFVESGRLRRCYEMFRGKEIANAGIGVFRPDAGLFLLVTQLRWEPNGEPYVPGNLDVWKKVFRQKFDSPLTRRWGRQAENWHRPDQLLEALFAISRVPTETGPLQSYLMLSELDSRRPPERRLKPETAALLASKFSEFRDQYVIFSEFPELDDASITAFVQTAVALNSISKSTLRGNALGTFQASIGLWQILARQGEIAEAAHNDSWQKTVRGFAKVTTPTQLFDAGHAALRNLLLASTSSADVSQDKIINLLAGPHQSAPEAQRMHDLIANKIRSIMDEQRLVSLDTLLSLGDGLRDGTPGNSGDMLLALAGELREFEMPQPIFRNSERDQWAAGIYNNDHTNLEMRTNIVKIIKAPRSPEQLAESRGQLVPFLRDTLVGLNYAYYEPPGAQVLHHNPLFVRSHDFAGDTVIGLDRPWHTPQVFGEGSPAGGGAHLVGSLADLPYVLAATEQDFIAPQNVQALIWRELVPDLLTNAVVPRWWKVTPRELHAVSLYQQSGEEIAAAATQKEDVREHVLNMLSDRMLPKRSDVLERSLRAGDAAQAMTQLTPADTFYLAAEYRQEFPHDASSFGPASKELDELIQQYPDEVSWKRLSRDFGVPHRVLRQSYTLELLNMPPLPVFMGYSSRLLAETWDSNNLFWARLADEKNLPPAMLNRLVPELTRRMVEKIFATDFEDWPALLGAARETAQEFRQGKIAGLAKNEDFLQP
jgi:hypothetical protein